uniref:hypothetical protein n=1 Tax=Pseudonocardia sp. CA-138482 TaxID=3240023 RepID=UPI003F491333
MASVVTHLPTVRAATSAQVGSASATIAVNVPAGTLNGDCIVVVQTIAGSGSVANLTAPDTSWALLGSGGSATAGWMAVWQHIASGDTAPWTFGKGATNGTLSALACTGHDPANPVAVTPVFTVGASSTSHVAPAVSTTAPNQLMVCAFGSASGGTVHSIPAGMAEYTDITVPASNGHATDAQSIASAGSTGTRTATASSAQAYVTMSLALSVQPTTAGALYAPSAALPYNSTAQNALVAIVGINGQGATDFASYGVSSVIDDAHNHWVQGPHVGTNGPAGNIYAGTHLEIWYCPAANPVTQVTVTASQTVDGIAVQLVEANGITNMNTLDVLASNAGTALTTITASATTANASDVIIAAAAAGDTAATLTHGADSWTTLPDVTTHSGVATADDVMLRGAYKVLSSAGAQSTAWTLSAAGAACWTVIALKAGAVNTSNPNQNWPQVVHQIAFGSNPNDPTVSPTWTDVTTRVMQLSYRRGRDYELARTEAGESNMQVRNDDGALDPSNSGSPYYPNVKVFTPYRMLATWNGVTYPVITGYVERWPQQWNDHFGVSPLIVVDGLATLAASQLQGSLSQEILADDPTAYWPLNEGIYQGTLGLVAANASLITHDFLRPVSSTQSGGTGSFSEPLVLAGESSNCWYQFRSIAASTDAPNALYGTALTVTMAGLPQPSSGTFVECWANLIYMNPSQNFTIFAVKSSAFTADLHQRLAVLRVDSNSGLPTVDVATNTGTINSYACSVSGLVDPAYNPVYDAQTPLNWHHYAVYLTASAVQVWIDGRQVLNQAISNLPTSTVDTLDFGGQVDNWTSQNVAWGKFAHAAVFNFTAVDQRRILQRANAGLYGFPEWSGARTSRVLNYANWTAGRAIDHGQAYFGGSATQALQSLLQTVQDIAVWENGLSFVDGSGTFRFQDRQTRFNTFNRWVFGDAPGEIAYSTDVQIEYDPTYIYNEVFITCRDGGGASHANDFGSQLSYFQRAYNKFTGVSGVSQCKAEAQWMVANYAQPRLRLATISITPSADASLWPVALGTEVGDKVVVKRRPFGSPNVINLNCYVEQIAHSVQPKEWKTTFSLSPVLDTTYPPSLSWTLNTSKLDIDTNVG